jgi:hypothetical protein
MQIAFHIGANCTDAELMLKSLLRNAGDLRRYGIVIPGPGKYRSLIREAVQGGVGSADAGNLILDQIIEAPDVQRLILNNDNFLAIPPRIFDHGQFYPQAEAHCRALTRLFADDEISLFLAIRNPVAYLQDLMTRVNLPGLDAYLGDLQPEDIRWSDLVARIRAAAPMAQLTIWCNEDSPLIWEDLLHLMAAMPADFPVTGGLDRLEGVLAPQGLAELTASMAALPPHDMIARHEAIAEAFETHALPQEVEEDITLPDLGADRIARITAAYEADLGVIAAMPGVRLVLPFRQNVQQSR